MSDRISMGFTTHVLSVRVAVREEKHYSPYFETTFVLQLKYFPPPSPQ